MYLNKLEKHTHNRNKVLILTKFIQISNRKYQILIKGTFNLFNKSKNLNFGQTQFPNKGFKNKINQGFINYNQ